jgi:capsular exopolysaccharide synthesis family protein
MQRTKETGISGELRTSNIRVVDVAELPRRPVRPNVFNNMAMALAGGLTLAIGLAFFFEYIDNRIKSPDEIKQHLGLPFLGMVPALFDDFVKNPMINNGVPANFAESFRGIRTNVLFSAAEEAGRSVVVTSTGPGEGKTVVAANLAIALAQAGLRVLLMDADMRKPRIHDIFGKAQQPGLSNVLVGNAKASEAVQQTDIPGLWILAAGLHPPNPAELLGSKRFRDFVTTLVQHFEYIVIDSPPVMAVTDSSVVAHIASGVLFVVGSEMTSRHAAQRALEQLANAKARLVGAILNRVDLQHNAYYYSQYYRREYSDYYQNDSSTSNRS